MKITLSRTAICVALATCGSFLSAQTATTSFDVTITIVADCSIAPPATLDFGTTGVLIADVTATTDLAVTCTSGTPFQIGVDEGTTSGGTITTRLMTNGADTVAYQLFQDAAQTVNWGNTLGADTLASTGTGSTQTFPVYGVVPPQATPSTGTYTDVVGVTVTF